MKASRTTAVVALTLATALSWPSAHAQTVFTGLAGAIDQTLDYTTSSLTAVYQSDVTGNSPASAMFTWSGACSTCSGYSLTGSGAAQITNGALGASTTLTVGGTPPGGNFFATSISTAQYADLLTVNGGTGTGVLVLQYSLSGTITQLQGTGTDTSSLIAGLGSAPPGTETELNGGPLSSTNEQALTGDGTYSDTLSVLVPFTYGTAFAIAPTLIAGAVYFPLHGNTSPDSSSVDFYNTMLLGSALVYAGTVSSLGALNTAATISSASGLGYGPSGITAVPLPAAAWLLLCGLSSLGALARRRRA